MAVESETLSRRLPTVLAPSSFAYARREGGQVSRALNQNKKKIKIKSVDVIELILK